MYMYPRGVYSFICLPIPLYAKEFIHLVASEANEECTRQTKKTIAPEHVLEALKVGVMHYYTQFSFFPIIGNRKNIVT